MLKDAWQDWEVSPAGLPSISTSKNTCVCAQCIVLDAEQVLSRF